MAIPSKEGKDLVQFDVKNAVYALNGDSQTVKPLTYMNTFTKDRNVTTKNLYGDGELQDSLYSDKSISGAIGLTARDIEFETDLGMVEAVAGGGIAELAISESKGVNIGFETCVKQKGKPMKIKKVWILNLQVSPPSESLTQSRDDLTESTFDYNYTGYGVNKKNAQGTADYVDAAGMTKKVYTVSSLPEDEGYATFLDAVPVPKATA